MAKKDTLSFKKTKLIPTIRELLQRGFAKTQEDIRKVLCQRGFEVNQTKISRVLHKLGAVKVSEGDRVVYRLPTELISVTPKNALSQLVLNISSNDVLIVIHTTPGSAQLVARLLDQQQKLGVLGTVAGDDTVFVAPKDLGKIQTVLQKISALLFE